MCDRGWDGRMVSPTPWTQVWASSGRRWRTAETGVLQSMGSQRVGHDWVTEQQQIICHLVMLVSELCKRSNLLYIIYVTFTQLYVSKNHLCCWMWWLLPHVHCSRYFMSWLYQNLFLFFSSKYFKIFIHDFLFDSWLFGSLFLNPTYLSGSLNIKMYCYLTFKWNLKKN